MKLKDLLAEGRFDMEGPECQGCEDPACACHVGEPAADEGNVEACPSCGRGPGDGYGADCDDPQGCGYWKDWARDAVEELRGEMKRDGAMAEAKQGDYFDRYMEETLALEDRKAKQMKAPLLAEGYGKIRQKRVQELPWNRIRVGDK